MNDNGSSSRAKAAFSRADLLWGFYALDQARHEELAELLGFETTENLDPQHTQTPQPPANLTGDEREKPFQEDIPDKAEVIEKNTATTSSYYRILSRQLTDTQPPAETEEPALPDWFTNASPTVLEESESRIPAIHRVAPLHRPLTPWSRLLPMLQRVLGDNISGIQPDMPRLVKRVADRRCIRRIPRRQRRTWALTARVLIDINAQNFPYRRDFIQLRERLIDARGAEGLDVQYVHDEPGGVVARYQYGRELLQPWLTPEKGTPILILSDLGMQGGSRRAFYAWLVFGQLLKVQGFRPTVLMPVAERHIDKRLLKYFDCIVWDRNSRLKRVKGTYQPEKDTQDHGETIDRLLAYFFAAVRVELGLLRAIRQILPPRDYDIGHESLLWRHPAVNREGDEWGWKASGKPRYLEEARRLLRELKPSQQERLVELIGCYHARYPDEIYFEAMYGLMMLGLPVPEVVKQATEAFMQDLVATYWANPDSCLLDGWVKRHLLRHADREHRQYHRYWLPFLAFAKRHEAKRNHSKEIEMPEDLSPEEKAEVLRFANQAPKLENYLLRQSGEALELLSEQAFNQPSQTDEWRANASMGAALLKLSLSDSHIFHTHYDDNGNQGGALLDLSMAGKQAFRFPATGQHEFQIGRERFHLEVKTIHQLREPWMQRVAYGSGGLWAESITGGSYYWHPPEWQAKTQMLPGFWHYLPPNTTDLTPDWAAASGRDPYGLYAEIDIAGVKQRFRWIEPTRFLMGSPEDENGRYKNETQHEVTLSQGYWLADTACTQALWQAVRGDNPSQFKGDNNPVEQVSWNDVEKCLEALNRQYPALKLRLPTEAEWENACRAGGGPGNPFNFAGELSLDKVNYRGTWDDYDNWGETALKKTTPVKSYPPNAWGLYEMHGNVWEWCQDWYSDYKEEAQDDLQGPGEGARRVLRGGSWFNGGRSCRSAYRGHGGPSSRYADSVGFRLARGQALKSVRSGASQQPLVSPAAERGGHERGMAGGSVDKTKKTQGTSSKSKKGFLGEMLDRLKK
jgi:formylglycine-generating enzyme required for sulfatase activity